MVITESLFKKGDLVVERIRPYQKLIVLRCEDDLYYCAALDNPSQKQLVYFGRELMGAALPSGQTAARIRARRRRRERALPH